MKLSTSGDLIIFGKRNPMSGNFENQYGRMNKKKLYGEKIQFTFNCTFGY
jgi:hypothetical protein